MTFLGIVVLIAETLVLGGITVGYKEAPLKMTWFIIFHLISLVFLAGGINFHLKAGEFPNPGIFFGLLGGAAWFVTVVIAVLAIVSDVRHALDHRISG